MLTYNTVTLKDNLLDWGSGTECMVWKSGGLVQVGHNPCSGNSQIHNMYTKTEFSRKWSTYIVIPRRPARIQLHVKLSFLPGQLIILGLFFPGQGVPLQRTWGRERKTCRNVTSYTVAVNETQSCRVTSLP